MKTVYTKRLERPGTKTLGMMQFVKGPAVILDFGDGKLKLGTAFIADAVEFYLAHAIKEGLNYAIKSRKK